MSKSQKEIKNHHVIQIDSDIERDIDNFFDHRVEGTIFLSFLNLSGFKNLTAVDYQLQFFPNKYYIISLTPPNSETRYENLSPGEPMNIKFFGIFHFSESSLMSSGPKTPSISINSI